MNRSMDKRLIAEATARLELFDIYLYSSSIERYAEIHLNNTPDDMVQQDKMAIAVDLLEPVGGADTSHDQSAGHERLLRARIDYGVRFVRQDSNDAPDVADVLAEITACFAATYHYHDELSEEAMKAFMRYNAVHNTWPFWREHALRMTAEARLPRPSIPLMKPLD
ncbi:hypothetical protein SAMN05443545_10670 [Aidingimonas halophila]|uniref:Preprotein translocase subunit SecB n=2 Tax=Aidingimonas halophila TaxID=574349 RepID=A0A1H3CPF0_9GAMM|nr:hypothetical protein SAMN05443545_10670 [Aidingimonas halophila]